MNPAMQFISTPEEEEKAVSPALEPSALDAVPAPPPGYKIDPRYIETKSRRLQVLIQPSLLKRVQKLAKQKKRSTNDMISGLLDAALTAEEAKSKADTQ